MLGIIAIIALLAPACVLGAYLGTHLADLHERRSRAFRARLIASCAHHLPGAVRDPVSGFTYRINSRDVYERVI